MAEFNYGEITKEKKLEIQLLLLDARATHTFKEMELACGVPYHILAGIINNAKIPADDWYKVEKGLRKLCD